MVTCPHCGFKQPEDIFCAKCGIDMKSYTPKKPFLLKTLMESSLFYVALLFFVVSVTTFFAYEKVLIHLQKENIDPFTSQLEYIPEDPDNSLSEPVRSSGESDQSLEPRSHPSLSALVSKSSPSQGSFDSKAPSETDIIVPEFLSGMLRLYFVVLSRDLPLFQTETAELRDAQYGVISQFARAFEAISVEDRTVLAQRSWQIEANNEPWRETFSLRGRGNDSDLGQIGILMDLEVMQISANNTILQPEINVLLAEGTRDNRRPYQDSIIMDPIDLERGDAMFIFGLLPHRLPSPIEQEELPENLRLLMESEDFIQLNTELFIIIEYVL